MLAASGDDVDAFVVAVFDHRGAEGVVRLEAPAELRGQRPGERLPVALDGQVDVEARLAEQEIANSAADEVDAALLAGDARSGVEHRPQPLVLREPLAELPVVVHTPILPPPWGQGGTLSARSRH